MTLKTCAVLAALLAVAVTIWPRVTVSAGIPVTVPTGGLVIGALAGAAAGLFWLAWRELTGFGVLVRRA